MLPAFAVDELTEVDTDVVVAVTAPSSVGKCNACNFLKYTSNIDDVVFDLDVLVGGIGDALAGVVVAVAVAVAVADDVLVVGVANCSCCSVVKCRGCCCCCCCCSGSCCYSLLFNA